MKMIEDLRVRHEVLLVFGKYGSTLRALKRRKWNQHGTKSQNFSRVFASIRLIALWMNHRVIVLERGTLSHVFSWKENTKYMSLRTGPLIMIFPPQKPFARGICSKQATLYGTLYSLEGKTKD